MRLDAFATEPHFIDHLAAVWLALGDARGRFLVGDRADLVARAASHGIQAERGMAEAARPVVVASVGDLHRAQQAGYRRAALMEHGAGQSYGGDRRSADHPSYAGGAHRSASLFLHPNEHAARRDRRAYPKARVEVVGCAKLETLPARAPGAGPVLAFGFHWDDARTVPEARSGFIYFRDAVAHAAERYTVIGHGHPRIIEQLAPWYERHHIEVVRDFREVCRRADVYGCDNSSTLFEFAATGRPVIVLTPTLYRRHIDHGLRFWDAASVGVQCDTGRTLLEAIDEALEDATWRQAEREQALELVYTHRAGAARRAAEALTSWLAERPAEAAA